MPLRIPDSHHQALRRLSELSPEAVERFQSALREADPAISIRQLGRSLAPKIGIPASQIADILVVLVSIINTRSASPDRNTSDIAADVETEALRVIRASGEEKEPEAGKLAHRLESLLEAGQSLEITRKASGVYFSHETLFKSSTILSDIRPIFPDDGVESPYAGTVVHNLALSVARNSKPERMFIALNVHDLRELKRTVDRALQKDASLKKFIAAAGASYIEDDPEEHQK